LSQHPLIELVNRALDARYRASARRVLAAINQELKGDPLQKMLKRFLAEATHLQAVGAPLTVDNPVFLALLRRVEVTMQRNQQLIASAAGSIQTEAALLGAELTLTLAETVAGQTWGAGLQVVWNRPSPRVLERVIHFIDMPEWAAELGGVSDSVLTTVKNQALLGVARGRNPVTTARAIRRTIQTMPRYQANTLMRTLQLQSYREAAAETQRLNHDVLQYQVRLAAEDDRTCIACIVLSGERYPVGQRIDDHHNGRCVGVPVPIGVDFQIGRGRDWLETLPETRQRRILGTGAYNALQAGAVTLDDFVHTHQDPVFGAMVGTQSLKGLLGNQASQYYGR